jgi:two-component system sensor histidine kinase UhpB
MAAPTVEMPAFGKVPGWFARLVGVAAETTRIPVSIDGGDAAVVIETDPRNEILEIWNSFADSALMLVLFFGPTVLLVCWFVARALRPLDRLAAALGGIAQGDYRSRLGGSMPRELSHLRDSFNRMAGQLSDATAENRRLTEQLLTLQEQERGDLARDLHDEIGPFLFAINIDAANIARHLDEGRLPPVRGHVQSIVEAVSHMQRQVRSMLGRLRPIGLAEFGLAAALANLVEFWRRRNPEIIYRLDIASDAEGFDELLDPTVYRIVQECLSNALRHGRPTAVTVSLSRQRTGRNGEDELAITVADDGQGMAAPSGIGYGLRGMSERVKALAGDLRISSTPGQGLMVTATLPCSARGERVAAERALAP